MDMAIFDNEPRDWRGLQDRVGQLFTELGCDAEVSCTVDLVRGKKEIDVLVRDPETTPASVYLCECKYWNSPIPQEVIHSFRTVLADFGAHRGFIISKVGFQAGAFEAVKSTNLNLFTFDQLQELFFDRWKVAMGRRYRSYADRLFPYWDYPGKMPKTEWSEEKARHGELLVRAYWPLCSIGPMFEMQGSDFDLPKTIPKLDEDGNLVGELTLNTYRQTYDFIESIKDTALKNFQVLYGEADA